MHLKILEMVGEWDVILCKNSRFKDDFKHINDMKRLLEYKGYRVPDFNKDATLLSPTNGLKTEEQLEEEDREAQGAKLENLLRLATPASLAEANDLMKVMSGYDTSRVPDYKKQVTGELDLIESRIILFNDMLNQKVPGKSSSTDANIEESYSTTKAAQNKLQNFIASNEDDDRLGNNNAYQERLLELNDLINMVLAKYNDVKNGKPAVHYAIDRKPYCLIYIRNQIKGVPTAQTGAISLIDFDDTPIANQQHSQQNFNVSNGLAGFNFGAPPQQAQGRANQFSDANTFPEQFGTQQNSSQFQQPHSKSILKKTSDDLLSMSIGSAKQVQIKIPSNSQSPVQVDLMSDDLLGIFGSTGIGNSKVVPPSVSKAAPTASSTAISGKLPPMTDECKNCLKTVKIFDKNGLQIILQIQTPAVQQSLILRTIYVNTTPVAFTSLNFQVAVPKV